jgi:hypothetical protein
MAAEVRRYVPLFAPKGPLGLAIAAKHFEAFSTEGLSIAIVNQSKSFGLEPKLKAARARDHGSMRRINKRGECDGIRNTPVRPAATAP